MNAPRWLIQSLLIFVLLFLWGARTQVQAGQSHASGVRLSAKRSLAVKVMTYNIRLNTPQDGENAWPLRRDFLASQILFHEPDVLGIQEGLPEQVNWLQENLPGYAFIGEGRDGGDNGEYSAIFYRKDKLKVKSSGTFWLSTTPATPSKGWDAALNRICTWAQFSPRGSGPDFLVFNTHFDHRGEQARVESARLILQQMDNLNPQNLPCLLTGDLNLTPDAPPIRQLTKVLRDAFRTASVRLGPAGTFNGFNHEQPAERRIDYIMTSADQRLTVQKFATLTDAIAGKYPSDHFPLIATLLLR